jgi:hypothetical protein
MPKFRTLDDIDVRGKRVLLRALQSQHNSARAAMSEPVIQQGYELREIARVFVTHRIKRVPVGEMAAPRALSPATTCCAPWPQPRQV